MKHGKVPTRNQKELMLKNNLNPKEWLVVKKMADGYYDIGSSYYGKYLRKLSD